MTDYLKADRVCDLVMKGGVTSGVVYPPAIDHIAQKFWLYGIGGASAGAIAAALAAAAEYQRRNGSNRGFDMLRELPAQFGDGDKLLALFKPDASTRRAFEFVIAAKAAKGGTLRRAIALSAKGVRLALSKPIKSMRENNFGLCTGMAQGNRAAGELLPPLTEWLDAQIDRLAAHDTGRPLTFGDLWRAQPAAPLAATAKAAEDAARAAGEPDDAIIARRRSIRLQMVSTCVSFGRPYALPYLDHRFAFSPAEFARLFPKRVVDYLVAEGRKALADPNRTLPPPPDGLLPFPVEDRFPVIVATRMSLSFPGLFSMIPFHYPDFHAPRAKGAPPPYRKVWFADGGLTSNMPIHFFDGPAPRWPTLGINLQYAAKKGEYGRANVDEFGVWMTKTAGDGRLDVFRQFGEDGSDLARLLSIVPAIFQSSQNWHDNSFLVLPGYADRVAEIWLDPEEGGLNLSMPAPVITRLLAKGDDVGRRLVARFQGAAAAAGAPAGHDGDDDDQAPTWDRHRWARVRSSSAALAHYLRRFADGLRNPLAPDVALLDVLKSTDAPPGYPFDRNAARAQAVRAACEKATCELLAWVDAADAAADGLGMKHTEIARPFAAAPRPAIETAARAPLVPLG